MKIITSTLPKNDGRQLQIWWKIICM